MSSYGARYVKETRRLLKRVDLAQVEAVAAGIAKVERLFVVGLGGSAAHASHAVNDFRKIAGVEAYCPLDNVAELTARINDDGWRWCLVDALAASHLSARDGLLVFSVGGGSATVSEPLVEAVHSAVAMGAKVLGIVGANGGVVAEHADACVVLPTGDTAQVEGLCAVVWHLIVTAL